jgi:hypothetical protein
MGNKVFSVVLVVVVMTSVLEMGKGLMRIANGGVRRRGDRVVRKSGREVES